MPNHQNKSELHPVVQKIVTAWPVIAAICALAAAGLSRSAQLDTNTTDIADLKARVDKLEPVLTDIRTDVATIKQEGLDHRDRFDRIDHHLDQIDHRIDQERSHR